jgi:hypothetical protein
MSAVLQPITTQAIQPPQYLNGRIRDFRLWYRDNEPKLSRYWDELGAALPAHERNGGDFWEFAAVQHELEEARVLRQAV